MVLMNSPLCRKCGAGEETSAHVLCECEALATLTHIYLGSLFSDPEDVTGLSLGQCGTSLEGQGFHDLGLGRGHKGPVKDLRASGPQGLDPHLFIRSLQFFHIPQIVSREK
jgi:hypothetical protein